MEIEHQTLAPLGVDDDKGGRAEARALCGMMGRNDFRFKGHRSVDVPMTRLFILFAAITVMPALRQRLPRCRGGARGN